MESPEKNMKFLWQAVNIMSSRSSKLVCHYLSRCQQYDGVNNLKLPNSLMRKSSICKYCGNKWSCGEFRSILYPRKRAGKKMRKLMRKAEQRPYLLRKCEKKMVSLVDRSKQNKLVLMCKLCHKETKILMQVPELHDESKQNPPVNEVLAVKSQKRQKKKKKVKDLFCGLNPAVFAQGGNSDKIKVDQKLSKEKLNKHLNAGMVRKKKQTKASDKLTHGVVLSVLQSEAKRQIHSSSSFTNFLSPVT